MGWRKQPEGWRLSEGPLHLLINVVQWASGILTILISNFPSAKTRMMLLSQAWGVD